MVSEGSCLEGGWADISAGGTAERVWLGEEYDGLGRSAETERGKEAERWRAARLEGLESGWGEAEEEACEGMGRVVCEMSGSK